MDVQLKFNFDFDDDRLNAMQCSLDAMNESMGKMRRSVFAQVGELKKVINELKVENEKLKALVNRANTDVLRWEYCKGGQLFDLIA